MVHSAQGETSLQMSVDDVSFVQRNTVKQAQITQFFSAQRLLVIYTFDLYPEVNGHSTMEAHA
jgi:hypothetical protein